MNKDINILYIEHLDGFIFRIHEDHPNSIEVMEQYDNYLPGVVSDYVYHEPQWIEFSSRYLSVVMDLTKIVGLDKIDIIIDF